ncbi:MAG: DUF4116 domain-containing protein, partial [Candidatus Rhabdochlamydia sp.]
MNLIASSSLDCSTPRIPLSSIHTAQDAVMLINTLLTRTTLCKHDIAHLKKAYSALETFECESQTPLAEDSQTLLAKMGRKVQIIHAESSAEQIMTASRLQKFADSKTNHHLPPLTHSLHLTVEKIKEIAASLPLCGGRKAFDKDVELFFQDRCLDEIASTVRQKRDQIDRLENIQKRRDELQQLREKEASCYPGDLDEMLDQGCFHLYDHLISMKKLHTQPERHLQESHLSFSTFSKIILEFKEMTLARMEKLISHDASKIIFLLGDQYCGKTTIFSYLQKDDHALQDHNDFSITPEGKQLLSTIFPQVAAVSGLTLVNFPELNNAHGQVISIAIELAFKALVKQYCPKIFILNSLSERSEALSSSLHLGKRLKRMLGTLDECILGITNYATDPDFIALQHIQKREQEWQSRPSEEELELKGSLKTLLSLVSTIPLLQDQIDQKHKELQKLEQRKRNLPQHELPYAQEKLNCVQTIQAKEESIKGSMGIQNVICFIDLTDPKKLEATLHKIKTQKAAPTISKQAYLDLTDQLFLKILSKNQLPQFTSSKNLPLLHQLDKKILETGLIPALLSQLYPEIGQLFHLEEMHPTLLQTYDSALIEECIQDYSTEVILDLIDDQEAIEKFKEILTQDQIQAIDHELLLLQRCILELTQKVPLQANVKDVKTAWEAVQHEHQQQAKNRVHGLATSGWVISYLLMSLQAPHGVFTTFKKTLLEKGHLFSAQELEAQLREQIQKATHTIHHLQEIKKMIECTALIYNKLIQYPLSLESLSSLETSFHQQIDQVKMIYGQDDWERKIEVITEELQEQFSTQRGLILPALVFQDSVSKDELLSFHRHMVLPMLYAFMRGQKDYQKSLRKLIPNWQPASLQKLELTYPDYFFRIPSLKLSELASLKTKVEALLGHYRTTPITRLILADALDQLDKRASSTPLGDVRHLRDEALERDRKEIMRAIQENAWILAHGAEWVCKDKDFILAAVKLNGNALAFAANSLKNDQEVVLAAIKQNEEAFKYASEELRHHRDFILNALKHNAEALKYMSALFQNEQNTVIAAVKQDWRSIEYASEALRNDSNFMKRLLQEDWKILRYVGETLRNDRGIVLKAIKKNGDALRYAGEGLRNNSAIVLSAITHNPRAFGFASQALKNDRSFILSAISKEKLKSQDIGDEETLLRYVSDEWQDDYDIVFAAIQKHWNSLKHASERLKDNPDLVLAAVKQNGHALKHASERLKDNPDLVLAAVKQNGHALKHASDRLKNDRNLILAAIKPIEAQPRYQTGASFYRGVELISAAGAFTAAKQNGAALEHTGEKLRDDPSVVLIAVQKDGVALQHASDRLKNDRNLVLAAVKQNGNALEHASKRLQDDHDLVVAAVKQNWNAL